MRQYLLDLYEIQKIDLGIREQQQQREALPAHLRELKGRVEGIGGQIATLGERRDGLAKEAEAMRRLVESETHKIRKWESRLNDIRNQREYQALSRETEGSRRANRDATDKIGDLLAQHDSIEADIVALRERLGEAQAACDAEDGRVAGELESLAAAMADEQARRNRLVPAIPKPMYRKYDTIRAKRLGIGLCAVSGGCCVGCNIRLPPQLYNVLQRADTVEQCPSCFRLIFWDQILPQPDAEAGAAGAEGADAAGPAASASMGPGAGKDPGPAHDAAPAAS